VDYARKRTHVQIDGDGNITGGPAGLKDKGITNLSHFGNKSSTPVDKKGNSSDTPVVSNSSTEQQGTKMQTLTIKGRTVRAAQKLKEMGFTFNPSSKTWSRSLEAGKSRYGDDGFVDDKGNFIGSAESILHTIKTHAKSDDVALTTSEKSESSTIPPESQGDNKSDSTEKTFAMRRDTRHQHYKVGQSVRSEGKDYIVTKVDRPFEDDHGRFVHGFSTRSATESEVADINKRRESADKQKTEHAAFVQRKHGGEMR
jgi:hypothetical protein